MADRVSRREFLGVGAGALAAAGIGSNAVIERALAAAPPCGRLADVEHVVFLMQENRSFDTYFGAYPGVRGFGDPGALRLRDGSGLTVFAQPGYDVAGYGGHLYPFHFDTAPAKGGECVTDVIHDWGPQHRSFNGGRMDGFLRQHLAANGRYGTNTMGYYRRADLAFYWALADAFTLCDRNFCSVLGPTDPNRLYWFSAWLDPHGRQGGPVLSTRVADRPLGFGQLTWTTMPEQLEARGISWKVYQDEALASDFDNVLPYFRQFQTNPTLRAKGLLPQYPAQFELDVAADRLPQVSWLLPSIVLSEHPPAPVEYGQFTARSALDVLTSNPKVWAKTVMFINWDENGGFFDHVPPPTPPPGTPGEFLTIDPLPTDAQGIAGSIGLGFRVPLLVVSPFSRGGLVCSDTFDHSSLLRFLETRFGAEVPNLTEWRRSVTGDLTSALDFAATPDASTPRLPTPSLADPRVLESNCPTQAPNASGMPTPGSTPYPVPPASQNRRPAQARGTARRPSGPVDCPPRRAGRGSGTPHGPRAGKVGGGASGVPSHPRGGVQTGLGGTADPAPPTGALTLGGGAVVAALAAGLAWRARRTRPAGDGQAGEARLYPPAQEAPEDADGLGSHQPPATSRRRNTR